MSQWQEGSRSAALACRRSLSTYDSDRKLSIYKAHQTPQLKRFSSWLAVVFAQYIEAKC